MLLVCREFNKYGTGMGPNTIMLSGIWQISSEDKMKDIHSVVTSHLFKQWNIIKTGGKTLSKNPTIDL
jgi:hypothetical protein